MADRPDRPTGSAQRRARRRQQDRLALTRASLFLIGFVLGLVGSLAYVWLLAPVEAAAVPANLRADYQADYIRMVSESYAADGDLAQAEARLARLGDPAIEGRLLDQLELYLRQGEAAEVIRNLAALARDVGAQGEVLALFAPTPATLAPAPTAEPTAAVATATPTLLPTPTASVAPSATPPPQPTATPLPTGTATPPPNFRLLSQIQLCQANLGAPQIQVVVVDAQLREMPGVAVRVEWDGGSDQFFTGFKPEMGPGFADFAMTADVSYSVSLPAGSPVVSGLRTEPCEDGEGLKGWELQFQSLQTAEPVDEQGGDE